MEANELRLNNYVWDEYSGIMVVKSIKGESDTVILCHHLNSATGLYSIKDIKPIPLTEQWLLDFGFEKKESSRYGNKYTYPMADWGYTIENSFIKGKWFFGHEFYDSNNEDENNISMNFCHNLEFVHNLQNIMHSLTGKELVFNPKQQ